MLSSVPKHKKAVMCLMEKIHMLGEPHSGISYSPVGHEFNISESTIPYVLNKVSLSSNRCKTRLCIDWLTKML